MPKSPDAFRTISEVATQLDVPQHVLRFWETKFSQIKPLKRAGGRRYYRPGDIQLIRGIQALLYGDGYTIKGVQRILKEQGIRFVVDSGRGKSEELTVGLTERAVDLEAGKGDLPVPPQALQAAPPQGAPAPATASALNPHQRDVMNRVLGDLVALKARVHDARELTQNDDDAPLLTRMRNPE